MKEFMLLFRADYKNMGNNSPEEWKAAAKKWNDWKNGISVKGKWVSSGQQLSPEGKIIKKNGIITDGPYMEVKEILLSYCTIKAESKEDAAELSKDCPILDNGGSVEIREIIRS